LSLPSQGDPQIALEQDRGVTDVFIQRGLCQVQVPAPASNRAEQDQAILTGLGRAGVSVWLVKLYPGLLSFVLDRENAVRAAGIIQDLGIRATVVDGVATVGVFARNMREMHDVMAGMAGCLMDAGAEILQSGDSHDTVFCLVPEERAAEAEQALRRHFLHNAG
jgi:aspartate kinase